MKKKRPNKIEKVFEHVFRRRKGYFIWTPLVLILLFFAIYAGYIVLNTPKPRADVKLGVTYSLNYARELGLDWQAAYEMILSDLQVKYLRLPVYWNIIEPAPGKFDFSHYDYMLQRAQEENIAVTLVVGRRQPRWPECHVPEWATGNSETVQQKNIIYAMRATIERYRESSAVAAWQVDNEPFLRIFGLCPPPDPEFVAEEIELVRGLDPTRPIQLTDTGELSTWVQTAALADWLGVSLYRITWNEVFGYWYYPLSPNFYRRHAQLIAPLVDKIIISELQAEPWFPGRPVASLPLHEQYETMNPEIFAHNVDFARRVGFDEAYLWGVEWWYWLKENKGDDKMWEAAKELFKSEV